MAAVASGGSGSERSRSRAARSSGALTPWRRLVRVRTAVGDDRKQLQPSLPPSRSVTGTWVQGRRGHPRCGAATPCQVQPHPQKKKKAPTSTAVSTLPSPRLSPGALLISPAVARGGGWVQARPLRPRRVAHSLLTGPTAPVDAGHAPPSLSRRERERKRDPERVRGVRGLGPWGWCGRRRLVQIMEVQRSRAIA